MKKGTLILIILTIIVVASIAFLSWPKNPSNNGQNPGQNQNNQGGQQQIVEGINITLPKANEEISSPLKITGTVNSGGWSGFEGQVGTAQLLDNKGNKIAEGVLKATTDWTKPPVQFELTLAFQTQFKGPATLLFSNENPSGLPAKDKIFGLPVIIK